jgi:hypothetical protein
MQSKKAFFLINLKLGCGHEVLSQEIYFSSTITAKEKIECARDYM